MEYRFSAQRIRAMLIDAGALSIAKLHAVEYWVKRDRAYRLAWEGSIPADVPPITLFIGDETDPQILAVKHSFDATIAKYHNSP